MRIEKIGENFCVDRIGMEVILEVMGSEEACRAQLAEVSVPTPTTVTPTWQVVLWTAGGMLVGAAAGWVVGYLFR